MVAGLPTVNYPLCGWVKGESSGVGGHMAKIPLLENKQRNGLVGTLYPLCITLICIPMYVAENYTCGLIKNDGQDPRIVGGSIMKKGSSPWQVSCFILVTLSKYSVYRKQSIGAASVDSFFQPIFPVAVFRSL